MLFRLIAWMPDGVGELLLFATEILEPVPVAGRI
jgi:hypothetical protein